MQGFCEIPMKDTSPRNFDINLNINITNIKNRYQSQYQYCRTQNLISIPIPIPRIMKFKLNLKTIPRYLDILRSQANTQKIRASIAQTMQQPIDSNTWHSARMCERSCCWQGYMYDVVLNICPKLPYAAVIRLICMTQIGAGYLHSVIFIDQWPKY